MADVKGYLEPLGGTVLFDDKGITVKAVKGSIVVVFQVGSNIAVRDGVSVKLDAPVQSEKEKVLIPSNFLKATFGSDNLFKPDNLVKPDESNGASEPDKKADNQDNVKVLLGNSMLTFETPPVIENGRVLVPMRAIFEELGATVTWNDKSQTVVGIRNEKKISLSIGDLSAEVNGNKVPLDVPAKLINNQTMVPLRFISEALGERSTGTAI
ncbi:MAG: hypothetical protein HPY81_07495 [Firmicutes bacterium]|nr:hypothetical protein [Bacillota bacterium]